MRAQLVPLEGGSPFEIRKDMTLVGRKEDCDLRLDHKSVSKLHCVIVRTDGLLLLRDLGSTNGTRVNGQRVRRAALLPNDKLTVANFNFRILFGAALVEAPPAPEEHTMQMDAREVHDLLKKPKGDEPMGESSVEMPVMHVQANALPDLYPEDDGKKA
ncbi:MAG: FHA domain-containing protein [Planctomycetes bacterium]|nr:FHA domain-containing protein [Planctomycetota bacterium]